MKAHETDIDGVWVIDLDRSEDDRGYFARTFSADEFGELGLPQQFVQTNVSYTARRHTLRGMHYQAAPHGEGKLISCLRGLIYDVLLDLRETSRTFRRWFATELSEDRSTAVYAPPGIAHGFVTLEDQSMVHYAMSERYVAEAARGVRWDDPAFGIKWPVEAPTMSPRDANFKDFVVPGSDPAKAPGKRPP